jgi:hypothetical protein
MKVVFDSGVLIGFSETCLLPLFESLKENIGEFVVTKGVKDECIDRVKNNMKFKLSAFRIQEQLDNFIFKVYNSSEELNNKTIRILNLTNSLYTINNNNLKLVDFGEAESLALLGMSKAKCLAIEERTTRMIVENPKALLEILKKKYSNKNIKFQEDKYSKFIDEIGDVKCIRSVDLIAYAYQNKLLPNFMLDLEYIRSVLYSLKFNGCSVSFNEIEEFISSFKS